MYKRDYKVFQIIKNYKDKPINKFMKYSILLLLLPFACAADIRDKLRKCLTLVEIESKRLKCYDNIVKPIKKKKLLQIILQVPF